MDIIDMAIQVGGAREGQSLVLKTQHLNFGKLSLWHKNTITDQLVKKYLHYKNKPVGTIISYSTFVMHHKSTSSTKIPLKG
jgi:hypothetical protein